MAPLVAHIYFGWPLLWRPDVVAYNEKLAFMLIAFIYLWHFQYKYDGVIVPDILLLLYPSRCRRRGMNSISYRCTVLHIEDSNARIIFNVLFVIILGGIYICCAKTLSKRYLANNFNILLGKWWRFICIAQALFCCMIINQ